MHEYDPHRHDPRYIKALYRLLAVIEDRHLAVPLAIGWRAPYCDQAPRHASQPHLTLQVGAPHFRQWLDAMDREVLSNQRVGERTHVDAWGVLKDNPRVTLHLVAVLTPTEVVAP